MGDGAKMHRQGTREPFTSHCEVAACQRVGRRRLGRACATTRVLLALMAAASFIACGDSDEEQAPAPPNTWDDMRWDEGVWQ